MIPAEAEKGMKTGSFQDDVMTQAPALTWQEEQPEA